MSLFTIERVIALPDPLAASTLYVVKSTDTNLAELYFTNNDGSELRHLINKTDILNLITDAIGGFSSTLIVATIAERDALMLSSNTMVLVLDATGDLSVASGAATYVYNAVNTTWYKISEYESLDLTVSWGALQDKPISTVSAIDLAATTQHTHSNASVLDGLTEDGTNRLLHDAAALAYLSDLAVKADAVHGHTVSDIAGLQTTLDALSDNISGGATVPTINGPSSTSVGLATLYTITNYDTLTTYTLSTTNGTITRSGDTLTYTPSTLGAGGFIVNGRIVSVNAVAASILTPSIISPAAGATGLTATLNLASSPFATNPGSYESHTVSEWQIATDSGFTNLVTSLSSNNPLYFTNWTANLPGSAMGNVTLYARVRYQSTTLTSEWSPTISFITTDILITRPEILSPVQFASGIPSGLTINAGGFVVNPVNYDTHASTDWQLATDPDFVNIVFSSMGDTVNKYSWYNILPPETENTTLYARIRFNGSTLISQWSETRIFTTKSSYAPSFEQAVLIAGDRVAGDSAGYSVGIDGDGTRVVIGAINGDPSGVSAAGFAYIWVRSGTTWTQEAKLAPNDPVANANFGYSAAMSMDGLRVIIGAYKALNSTTPSGAAYIFARSGTAWTQEARVISSIVSSSLNFGISVDLSADGSRAVVGSPGYTATVGSQGRIHIFIRSGTAWSEEAAKISSSPAGEFLGFSVAMDGTGTRVIAGAYKSSTNTPVAVSQHGTVYVFTRSGSTWTQEARIFPANLVATDWFGYSCDINYNGDRLVVGSQGANGSSGKAYTFTRSGTTWTQEAEWGPPDPVANGFYGASVGISSDGAILIIGAPGKKAAYTYRLNAGTWDLEAEEFGSITSANSNFGIGVGISQDGFYGIVGAYNLTAGGTSNAGAGFILN